MAAGACRRLHGRCALAVSLLAVNAVVILARDVAAGKLAFLDHRFVAMAGGTGGLDPGHIRARIGSLDFWMS